MRLALRCVRPSSSDVRPAHVERAALYPNWFAAVQRGRDVRSGRHGSAQRRNTDYSPFDQVRSIADLCRASIDQTHRGLSVQGSFRYGPGDYRLAIAFVEQGRIDLKPLVSHRYSFDDALKAYQAMVKGERSLLYTLL